MIHSTIGAKMQIFITSNRIDSMSFIPLVYKQIPSSSAKESKRDSIAK